MTDDKAGARSSPEPEVGSGRSGRSGRFWRGRLLRGFGGLAITALALGLGLFAWLHEPRPTGETGARAEALAARVEAAVDIAAWRKTGAVSWVFGGRHRHLWDRERHIALVEWGDERARVKLDTRTGRAWRGGVELEGEAFVEREAGQQLGGHAPLDAGGQRAQPQLGRALQLLDKAKSRQRPSGAEARADIARVEGARPRRDELGVRGAAAGCCVGHVLALR